MYDVRESCLIIESNLFDCKEMGFLVFKEHMIPLDWYFMKWLDVIYRLYLKTFNIWLKSCYIFNKTESYIFSSLNHITLFEFEDSSQSMFDNLATLADVMLASAGQLEDKSLKRKIDLARAKISQTILPITPEMSSKRTMQVTNWISFESMNIKCLLIF